MIFSASLGSTVLIFSIWILNYVFLLSISGVLISNHTILSQFCKDHNIGCVIAGPETLLDAGKLWTSYKAEDFNID